MRNAMNAVSDFVHLIDPDGVPESICLHCFATVLSFGNRRDARLSEAAHVCWQREEAGPLVDLTIN